MATPAKIVRGVNTSAGLVWFKPCQQRFVRSILQPLMSVSSASSTMPSEHLLLPDLHGQVLHATRFLQFAFDLFWSHALGCRHLVDPAVQLTFGDLNFFGLGQAGQQEGV